MNLATWDLPAPQGPLLPNLLPEGSPARPAHGVWVYVPVHYPLQGDDPLHRKRGKHALIWRDRALDIIFNGKEWNI